MMIDTKTIKEPILKALNEARKLAPVKGKASVIDGRIQALEVLMVAITNAEKKGDETMGDLKLAASGVVKYTPEKKEGTIDAQIIKEVKDLKEVGDAKIIDTNVVGWHTFSNRVYALRAQKRIPEGVRPRKNKKDGKVFLVLLEPGD